MSIVTAFFYLKHSYFFYHLAWFATICFLGFALFENFSKVVLLVIFLYTIISCFVGYAWQQSLGFACYNSRISRGVLDDPAPIKVFVTIKGKNGKSVRGSLTNWDEGSCFVSFLGENLSKIQGHVNVTMEYNGIKFEDEGTVASHLRGRGSGIIFNDSKKRQQFNWVAFNDMMTQLALVPEYLTD